MGSLLQGSRLGFTLLMTCGFAGGAGFAPVAVSGQTAPAALTRDQDYARMFAETGVPMPGPLPPLADDPRRPAGVRETTNGHWADGAGRAVARSPWGGWTNYEEAKANPYPLTDPLRLKSGQEVTDPATWWQRRRPEILHDFETEIYGTIPAVTPAVTWEVTRFDTGALGGLAIRQTVIGHIDHSSYPAAQPYIELTLWLPARAVAPVPLVMVVDGAPPAGTPLPAAVGRVLALGWAYGSFACSTVQADTGAGFGTGIIGLVNHGRPRQPTEWGVLAAWAWGLSAAVDYLQTNRAIDCTRLGIEGHSRRGKAALLAAAYDSRWAVCYASCSGEGGAKPSRRNWGETLDNVAAISEYHWMAGNFLKYGGHWNDLPVDAPELLALIAPRPVLVTGGTGDPWADPHGEFLAAVAVGPVYRLLGGRDLGTTVMPAPDQGVTAGDIAFREHLGGHVDDLDWPVFLGFAARYFRVPGFVPEGSGRRGPEAR